MAGIQKLYERAKRSPNNFSFRDLCRLMEGVGYELKRIKGSHQVFLHPVTGRAFSVQEGRNGQAKAYQVTQVVDTIEYYALLEG